MSKLSVIICVYNTDETMFKNCLNSVFNSTVKDLEVVIVDDGSTKNYSKLLKKFNVKYFKTENQGTLQARLFGIKQCTGDFICFVDSDDSVSFNYFEASLNSIKDADIVLNDWAFETKKTKYVCLNDSTINLNFEDNYPLNKFFEQQGREHSFYVLWNKIFKKDILISVCEEIGKLNITNLVYAEDVLINYFAFKNAKKVVNTHYGYYFYKIHNNQQITVNTKEKLINHINQISSVFNIIEKDLKTNKKHEMFNLNFHAWKQLTCSKMFVMAKKFKCEQLNNLIKKCFSDCKLKNVPHSSDYAYFKQKVLPNNIEEINKLLEKIYYANKTLKVFAQKGGYAYNSLIQMKRLFNLKFNFAPKSETDIILPKEKISLKQKIMHNQFLCKIGVLLFPKGSKLRNLVKKQF